MLWHMTQPKSISVLSKFIQLININYFFSNCISHRLSQTLSRIFYLVPEPMCLQSNVVVLMLLLDFFFTSPIKPSNYIVSPSPTTMKESSAIADSYSNTFLVELYQPYTLTVAFQSHRFWVVILPSFDLIHLLFKG